MKRGLQILGAVAVFGLGAFLAMRAWRAGEDPTKVTGDAKNIPEKNFKTTLTNAFLNTTPYVSVKTKRKGSKNIYLPLKITKKRGKYLSAKWLLTNSFAKQKRNFYEGIVEELIDSSLKKSLSVKKRDELHKLADESLVNLK